MKVIDGVADGNGADVGWFASAGGGDTTIGCGLCIGGWSCQVTYIQAKRDSVQDTEQKTNFSGYHRGY